MVWVWGTAIGLVDRGVSARERWVIITGTLTATVQISQHDCNPKCICIPNSTREQGARANAQVAVGWSLIWRNLGDTGWGFGLGSFCSGHDKGLIMQVG